MGFFRSRSGCPARGEERAIDNINYERAAFIVNDFRYAFYAVEGFSNRQVASLCGVSERTAAKRYNDIYNKPGINSKQELITEMSMAFGKK